MKYTEYIKFPREKIDEMSRVFSSFMASGQPCEFADDGYIVYSAIPIGEKIYSANSPYRASELNIDKLITNEVSAENEAKSKKEDDLPYLTEGSIRRRKDNGRWEIRFMYNGKQVSISHRNQEECVKRFKTKIKERDRGIKHKPEQRISMLFDWIDEWFKMYKVGKVSAGWERKIKICIQTHIKPNFKNVPLGKLNPIELEKGLERVESSRMREDTYTVLNMALGAAYKKMLIKHDIMKRVEKYKHKRKNSEVFSKDEQNLFLSCAKEHGKYYNYYLFYFYTGCRPDEINRIRGTDIDIKNKTIYIDGTKTPTSKRTIPLFSQLFDYAKEVSNSKNLLFPLNSEQISYDFKKCLRLAGLDKKGLVVRSMRHSFITRLFESEVDIKTISIWAGHSNVETTRKIYIHLLSEYEKKQITKFDPKNDPKN